MHFAAKAGQIDVVNVLLKADADPLVENKHERCPRAWAEQFGHNQVAAVIKRAQGLEPEADQKLANVCKN